MIFFSEGRPADRNRRRSAHASQAYSAADRQRSPESGNRPDDIGRVGDALVIGLSCAAPIPGRHGNPPAISRERARRRFPDPHLEPWRSPDPHRSGGLLDRGRHAGDHGELVARHRHLFRLPGRRACPHGDASGGDAIRLRRPACRDARAGRSRHQPPTARPGAARAEGRADRAPAVVLEQRATALGNIGGCRRDRRRPRRRAKRTTAPNRTALKPSPMLAPASFSPPAMREAKLESLDNASRALRITPGNMQAELARSRRVARSDRRPPDQHARRHGGELRSQGAAHARLVRHSGHRRRQDLRGSGRRPIHRLSAGANSGSFDKQLYRINIARAQVDRLTATLGKVPLRKPIEGEIDTSSGFGVRIDPFVSKPAMHTGIDFRGDTGDAVRVTAGRHRGIGRMERRLRAHDRGGPRQRAGHPLRASI